MASTPRTKKQQDAARRNGARSHGPVTPEGKSRSAVNATRHGLSGTVVVLRNESSEAFRDVLGAYLAHWQPETQPELDLVHDLVAARWRLNRSLALETASLDLEMDRQRTEVDERHTSVDEPTRCALAFHALAKDSHSLGVLSRHELRLRRIIDRAGAELSRLRDEREGRNRQNEPGEAQLMPDELHSGSSGLDQFTGGTEAEFPEQRLQATGC